MSNTVITDVDEGIGEKFRQALWHVDSAAGVIGCCQTYQRQSDSLRKADIQIPYWMLWSPVFQNGLGPLRG